jgi:1-hydroxycarotenoid 3,4-desaturase
VGVDVVTGARVDRVVVKDGVVCGVDVAGAFVAADSVVVNADVGWLKQTSPALVPASQSPPSMSGATAIVKARRRRAGDGSDGLARVAHEVLFSADYESETQTIFAKNAPPPEPTVYLCAQELAHSRVGWAAHEPVFAMVNVPPIGPGKSGAAENAGAGDDDCLVAGLARARARGLLANDDEVLWRRGSAGLAQEFPGSDGSLYGASSNDRQAAFRRPANASGVSGLYLASGSAHPGGGVPLCLQSGLLAADALLNR